MGGTVVPGDKRATKMNFPTANIIPPNLIHPKKGVYAIKARYIDQWLNGIANFGERPTVECEKMILEVDVNNGLLNLMFIVVSNLVLRIVCDKSPTWFPRE